MGFKDATGKTVVEPKYDEVGAFSSGLAPVNLGAKMAHVMNSSMKDGGKWGYVDLRGKLVVPITLKYAHEFSDGLARVYDDKGLRYLDPSGKVVIDLGHCYAGDFHEGLAPVYEDRSLAGKDWRTRCIDKKGLNVFIVDGWVEEFSEGLAVLIVKQEKTDPNLSNEGKLYGFIERSGKVAISPRFGESLAFHEGVAAVRRKKTTIYGRGDTWGYIDKSGKYVIEPQFNEAHPFQNGIARVHVCGTLQTPIDIPSYWDGGEWRLIDRTGKVLKQSKKWLEYKDALVNTDQPQSPATRDHLR
ncbi:MAG: WG repeat-containing protein [Thermoguttaceae bacterium]